MNCTVVPSPLFFYLLFGFCFWSMCGFLGKYPTEAKHWYYQIRYLIFAEASCLIQTPIQIEEVDTFFCAVCCFNICSHVFFIWMYECVVLSFE